MEVKERILLAAEELFLQYGAKSITMDDIARHLAVSKKTIYQFFKDKDEIVYMVTMQYLERDKQNCTECVFQLAENPVDELLRVSKFIKANLTNVNPSLLYDLNKYHPKAWKLYQEHKNGFILEHIKRNLRQGIEDGYYRKDINVEVMARFRIEQVQMAFDTSVFPPAEFNFLEIQIQFLDHFIRGIVTEKGRQVLEQYYK